MAYVYYTDQEKAKYFEIPVDRMVVFGREDHTDFQILNDPKLSREHFCIKRDDDGCYVIIDLGSRNGTFVNDRKLQNETFNLRHDDEIKAGSQTFIFKVRRDTKTRAGRVPKVVLAEADDGDKGFKTVLREID